MHKDGLVRVLIAGHQGIVRESLAVMLASQPGVVCVNGEESCDVVLVNHDAQWDNPLEVLVAKSARTDSAKTILVLTTGLDLRVAKWLVRQGVGGLFLKHNSLAQLLEALRAVASGETWFDEPYSRLSEPPPSPASADHTPPPFTPREILALRALLDGCSNKEIGAQLGASESAAKGLLQRLFRKTRVRSRGQLIRMAMERYRDLL